MASKKSRAKALSEDDYYEELSTESESAVDPDWQLEEQRRKSLRRLAKSTQEFAEEAPKNRRKPGKAGAGGNPKKKKAAAAVGRSDSEGENKEPDGPPRQCYWLDCVNAARKGSKYCSDECGINLATYRIKMILPQRHAEWQNTPPVAEVKDRENLKKVQVRRQEFMDQFFELDRQREELDAFIETISKISFDPALVATSLGGSEEGVAPCVVCGHDTSVKSYMKHVDRCFIRTEKQILFESKEPANHPGIRLFCDVLSKETGLYCKRLYVNCPDHSKKVTGEKNAICGAPLSNELDLNNVCRALKRTCLRHYNWENMRRAEIDIQKVVVWTSQIEMAKEEEKLLQQMRSRGGLLDLMINSTIIENP